MKQKVIVVLIPTANPSIPCIIKSDETDNLGITDSYGLSDIGKSFTPMNMYILDPTAEIKEGLYVRHPLRGIYKKAQFTVWDQEQAIVASNDPKLTKEGIPTISETFLKEYIASGEGCEVEMETENKNKRYGTHVGGCIGSHRRTAPPPEPQIPKKDSEGNLVLSVVKKEEEKIPVYDDATGERIGWRILTKTKESHPNRDEEAIQKQIDEAASEYAKKKKLEIGGIDSWTIEKLARESWINNHVESDNILDWYYYLKGFQDASTITAIAFGKWINDSEHAPHADGIHWVDCVRNVTTTEELYTMFKEQQL